MIETGIKIDLRDIFLRAYDECDLKDYFAYAKVEGINENSGKKQFKTIKEAKKAQLKFLINKNVFSIVDKKSARCLELLEFIILKKNFKQSLIQS